MNNLDANRLLGMTLADLLPVLEDKLAAGGCPLCEQCDGECEKRARELLTPHAEMWAERWQERDLAADLAGMIDHTLLKPDATPDQVKTLCQEARTYEFASVCVNPSYVLLCVEELQDSGVPVCTVAGFPLGATAPAVKVYETNQAVQVGAAEVDMVLSIGALKAGNDHAVSQEIDQVADACHNCCAICKVIIETALLTDEEKVRACQLSVLGRADFVKTSTGFAKGGATVYDVLLMRYTVGDEVGVKASGGVRSLSDACKMLVAGANRIGASAGVRIVEEARGAVE
jgi:deoxyribose-phosphate aldolase